MREGISVEVASRIAGWGMYVPERIIPNSHFASYLETTDEWITERTGIKERRWADETTGTSEIAAPACKMAIDRAGLRLEDIDGIICATASPDYGFPNTACVIQERLGLPRKMAFDLGAACTGFLYAMSMADGLIRSSICNNIVVVGAEVFSALVNKKDRGTCVLFGDGAGAVVVSKVPENERSGNSMSLRGIYSSDLRADGSKGDILCMKNGTANRLTPERVANGDHFLTMEGREVFKFAVRALSDVSNKILEKTGMTMDDIDYVVSHQANQRILAGMAKHLKISMDKVPSNVDKYGNTSAASIPILLSEMAEDGRIQEGTMLLLNAVGGGMTWGSTLVRW